MFATQCSESVMEEKQVTAVIVGAGSRGFSYANYALDFPQKFKVINNVTFNIFRFMLNNILKTQAFHMSSIHSPPAVYLLSCS